MEDQKDDPPERGKERSLRTIDLKASTNEMLKPGELIDVRGTQGLRLFDRQVYNKLLERALGPQMW